MTLDEEVASLGELELQFLRNRWPLPRMANQTYRTPWAPWARDAHTSLLARGLVDQWVHARTGELTYRLSGRGAQVVQAIHELDEAQRSLSTSRRNRTRSGPWASLSLP
jgi:hypothetical protein